MSKIYLITVDAKTYWEENPEVAGIYLSGDLFYVRAKNSVEAEEHLRKQITKYYFKARLSNKAEEDPKRLGEDIIVEGFVTEETASAPLIVEDITPAAYMWSDEGKNFWKEWNITLEDCRNA